jgi:hypothetical protein
MPHKKKKKKRKPIRYKTITIKLTSKQKRSLERFCRSRRTTPNKMIKKAIRPLLEDYADLEVMPKSKKPNQLNLFQPDGELS